MGNNQFAQLGQIQVVYFDKEFLEPIRHRARVSINADMENILVWREVHEEVPHGAKTAAAREFAQAARCSPQTLRRKLQAVNGFSPEVLSDFVNGGLSWEHLQVAHDLSDTAYKTPRQLLQEAIDPGNAHGDTMTVNELIAHALGERAPRHETYAAFSWLSRLAELPSKFNWDAEKRGRFEKTLQELKGFFE